MTDDDQKDPDFLPDDAWASLQRIMSLPALEGLAKEVIKRLNVREADDWAAPTDEIRQLSHLLCARYPFAAHRMVYQLLDAGVPIGRVYQNYLAEAARFLGTKWEKNELSFQEVGSATTRIYLILDALRRRSPQPIATQSPKIAFAAVPGEQHDLGVKMAVDVFRRDGWDVIHLVDAAHDEVIDAVQDADIVLVGLSASGKRSSAALLRLLVALRIARPELHILLSGEITKSAPEFLAQVGIDEIVTDIRTALDVVERLLRKPHQPSGAED